MNDIARHYSPGTVITATSSANGDTGMIPYGRFGGGCVMIAATNGCTQITWYGSVSSQVPALPIYEGGALVTTAVTVGVHPIPDACFACNFVVPVVTGGSTCAMTVMSKG